MQILVIGATGQSGIDFAREALAHNHSLTLYVRSPGKLPQDIKDNARVTIVQGGFDADLETIRPAITNGAEAIVSTAGPIASNNGNGTSLADYCYQPVTDFYEKLYKLALKEPSSKIGRTLILNTCSYEHPGDGTRWIWRLLVRLIHKFSPDAYREIVATGKLTSAQPVDKIGWTLFRVPFLTNGASKPTVATIIGSGEDGLLLSRKSLAAWLLKELEEGKWIGKAPALSSGGNWL